MGGNRQKDEEQYDGLHSSINQSNVLAIELHKEIGGRANGHLKTAKLLAVYRQIVVPS
jgi:hypothetical protein